MTLVDIILPPARHLDGFELSKEHSFCKQPKGPKGPKGPKNPKGPKVCPSHLPQLADFDELFYRTNVPDSIFRCLRQILTSGLTMCFFTGDCFSSRSATVLGLFIWHKQVTTLVHPSPDIVFDMCATGTIRVDASVRVEALRVPFPTPLRKKLTQRKHNVIYLISLYSS